MKSRALVKNLLLSRVGTVGWHVHHERSSTTVVKEVDGTRRAASVGGGEVSVEVLEEVDALELASTWSQDTWNSDQGAWVGGVVANDGSVDDQSQDGLLVGRVVLHQQSSGVVVANGLVSWSLSRDGSSGTKAESDGGRLHVDCLGWLTTETD